MGQRSPGTYICFNTGGPCGDGCLRRGRTPCCCSLTWLQSFLVPSLGLDDSSSRSTSRESPDPWLRAGLAAPGQSVVWDLLPRGGAAEDGRRSRGTAGQDPAGGGRAGGAQERLQLPQHSHRRHGSLSMSHPGPARPGTFGRTAGRGVPLHLVGTKKDEEGRGRKSEMSWNNYLN